MTIVPLDTLSFDHLIDSFLKAFEGYFVTMPADPKYYAERWKAAKVDYSKSYGVLDGSTLAGFIVHAVDRRSGVLTAYNSGTGVIPDYRGQGLVNRLYDYALPDLKSAGVQRSTLEVITKNAAAIAAYKKVGFQITRSYQCYRGALPPQKSAQDWIELPLVDVDWDSLPDQSYYSWDNQKESLMGSSMRYFQWVEQNKAVAYCILHPDNHYVAQWGVWQDTPSSWQALKDFWSDRMPKLRINNVDTRLSQKIAALNQFGFENHIDQYEMALTIH